MVQVCEDTVLVPRRLLREVIADGCCPLHLRLQLVQAISVDGRGPASTVDTLLDAKRDARPCGMLGTKEESLNASCSADPISALLAGCILEPQKQCLMGVVPYLPLAEVLSARACGHKPLQWAMQVGTEECGPLRQIH